MVEPTEITDAGQEDSRILRFRLTAALATPETIISSFWEENEAELRRRISQLTNREALIKNFGEHFDSSVFQHEKAFVDHVLRRLTQILAEAENLHDLDSGKVIFNIQTSLLYDIDGTLAGALWGRMDFGIRPSAVLLLKFISEQFERVRIGIISGRGQEWLDKQMVDQGAPLALTEIAPYVNGGAVGIYNISGFDGRAINPNAFDSCMYPEWQPEEDIRYALTSHLGFSSEQAEEFMRDQLPVFIDAMKMEDALRAPGLCFETELKDDVSRTMRVNKEQKMIGELLVAEILLRTFDIAHAVSANEDGKVGEIVEAVILKVLPEMNEEQKALLKPHVEEAVLRVLDYIKNLAAPEGEDGWPADKYGILRRISDDKIDFLVKGNLGFLLRISLHEERTPDNAFYRLRNRVLIDESGPEIMRSAFQNSLRLAINNICEENIKHQVEFEEKIAELLGVDKPEEVAVALQRMAACRRQLDEGAAQVAVAIDNKKIAEKMDQLLLGNICDPEDGLPMDGYSFLGIPDRYRGRLCIIHVGDRAEYSKEAFQERIESMKAA